MAITAAMVKELRELSGAGMMDCKKALNETNGDMEAAMELSLIHISALVLLTRILFLADLMLAKIFTSIFKRNFPFFMKMFH